VLDRRTGKLDSRGIYSGPVDDRQIKLGDDPAGCANQVARWNAPAHPSVACRARPEREISPRYGMNCSAIWTTVPSRTVIQ
jgi:hypothetical protein